MFEVDATRIDVRCVAQPKFEIDGRGHADDLRDLVVAGKASQAVRALDVEVYRYRNDLAQSCEAGQRNVRGDIDGVQPVIDEQFDAQGVGCAEQCRRLYNQVTGQLAASACLINEPEETFIGDKHTAQAELHGALDVAKRVYELVHAHVSPAEVFAVWGQSLCGTFPGSARAYEEAHFDAVPVSKLNHLIDFSIAQQHNATALGNALDRYAACLGGFNDGAQCSRAFHAWYLHAIVRAVGERLC